MLYWISVLYLRDVKGKVPKPDIKMRNCYQSSFKADSFCCCLYCDDKFDSKVDFCYCFCCLMTYKLIRNLLKCCSAMAIQHLISALNHYPITMNDTLGYLGLH